GSTSVIATASMNPAPKATKCSITLSPRAAWRITAAAPSRLPPAAISAYHRALDTTRPVLLHALQETLPRVARRVVEHLREQQLQHLSHVRSRSHTGSDQIVALHGEVGERERVLGGTNSGDDPGEWGVGSGTRGEQRQQVVHVLPGLRQPAPHRRQVVGIGYLSRHCPMARPRSMSLFEHLSRVSSDAGSDASAAVISTGSLGSRSTSRAFPLPAPHSRISGSQIRAAPTSTHSVTSFETLCAVAI